MESHKNHLSDPSILPSQPMIAFFLVLVVCLVASAFGASLHYPFSMLDDSYLIVTNLATHGMTLEHLVAAFTTYDPELYIPLTIISFQINYMMDGLRPEVWHMTNLALQCMNALLVGWVFLLLTRKQWAALAGGLLFAVHPLHTEAVVWISGRKDLLSTFFFLATWIAYLSYRHQSRSSYCHYRRLLYCAGLFLFILALLSKALVATLPAVLLLSDALEHRPFDRRMLIDKIPFFIASGIFMIVATYGKTRVIGSSTFLETVLMAGKSTVFYLLKLFVPLDLTVFYPYQKTIALSSPDFYLPSMLLIALCILALISLRYTRWIAGGFFFFLLTLTPTFLNFHKGQVIYFAVDRYAYIPSIGILLLFLLFLSALYHFLSLTRLSSFLPVLGIGCIAGLIGLFVMLSQKQTRYWQNDTTLFSHARELYPQSAPALNNLAILARHRGDTQTEKALLLEALTFTQNVELLTALGSVFARAGEPEKALEQYQKAITLDPKSGQPYFFIGSLKEEQNDIPAAIDNYQKALDLDDSYVAAYNNLASILLEQGKPDEARMLLEKALVWNPNFMEGHYNLFQVLERQQRKDEAFSHLKKAYALYPESSDISLAYAYRLIERKEWTLAQRVLTQLKIDDPANSAAQRMEDFLKKAQQSHLRERS